MSKHVLVIFSLLALSFKIPLWAQTQNTLKGFIHYDVVESALDNKQNTSSSGIRRIRLDYQGKINPKTKYRINLDLAKGTVDLLDGHVDLQSHFATFRFGKSKSPLGYELLQTPTDLIFPSFGPTTAFVPNRDTGIFALFGDAQWQHQLALLAGASDGSSLTSNPDFASALVARTFGQWGNGLSAGIAISTEIKRGKAGDTQLASYKSPSGSTFFTYGTSTVADGSFSRVVPQATYLNGQFGALAEAVLSQQSVQNGSTNTQLTHSTWQLSTHYNLTGEAATFGRFTPKNSFDEKGFGAVQIAARIGETTFDDDTFPTFASLTQSKKIQQLGLAANWFWDHQTKWSFEANQLQHQLANGNTVPETAILTRLQITY